MRHLLSGTDHPSSADSEADWLTPLLHFMDDLGLHVLLLIRFFLTHLGRNFIHSNLRLLQRLFQSIKYDLLTFLALVLIGLLLSSCAFISNKSVTDTCLVQLMIAVLHLDSNCFVLDLHVAFEAGVKIGVWLFKLFLERKGTELAK